MSAAEPAHPNGPDRAPLATVHPLTPARPRRTRRSERTSVPTHDRLLTPHEKLAARLESAYARHHRSLTDESTALDFRIALAEFRQIVRGMLETGLLTEDQHRSLDGMLEAMEGAPGLIAT